MAKLNRDAVLHNLLMTLVDGWGYSAVQQSLEKIRSVPNNAGRSKGSEVELNRTNAVSLVSELPIDADRKTLMIDLAGRFDEGRAFPKTSDIRAFLLSHNQNAANVTGRLPGFRRMMPVLQGMSPKGLQKLISRSHHSGPADLGAISDAIRGAGEDMRGGGGERHIERNSNDEETSGKRGDDTRKV